MYVGGEENSFYLCNGYWKVCRQ